jgi:hypothetical protein
MSRAGGLQSGSGDAFTGQTRSPKAIQLGVESDIEVAAYHYAGFRWVPRKQSTQRVRKERTPARHWHASRHRRIHAGNNQWLALPLEGHGQQAPIRAALNRICA